MNRTIFPSIPILNYHKIDDRWEVGVNCVKPANFLKQLEWLNDNGFNTVTFEDLLSNTPLPPNPIIISFDDGYESVYLNALPAMQKFGYRGVIFILTGYLGKENSWDANLLGKTFRHLNEKQIQKLAQAGFEIASHGVSHQAMVNLNAGEVEAELHLSRRLLSQLAEKDCVTFAYPFGIQNPEIQKLVRQAGYRFACVNVWGGSPTNPYRLPRFPVYRFDNQLTLRRYLKTRFWKRLEIIKVHLISWSARLTPIYQRFGNRPDNSRLYHQQRNLIQRFSIKHH
ncbi:MAG: hypothetical protein Kow0037_16320 [Calditrichia bacterium]